jgi:rubrerythrin
MKKNILAIVLLAASSWLSLPSCSSNPDKNSALQSPETAQAITQPAVAASDAKAATINNLKEAFTGETTASAKYAAYSKKAQEEGFTQIALLFKATSKSEMIHANNHRAVLEDMGESIPAVNPQYAVKTTLDNLADAIAGESYEIATMYPEFITAANSADNQLALTSLNYAYRTEQRHKPMYEKALAALQNNQTADLPGQYLVCPTCGNTYDAAPPKRCRISMTPNDRFIKINSL